MSEEKNTLATHGEKIASLETGYAQVSRDVMTLSSKFDTLTANIMARFDAMAAARKPQFGVWAAWASVLIMTMAVLSTPLVMDLRELERNVARIQQEQVEQAYKDGRRDALIEQLMEK